MTETILGHVTHARMQAEYLLDDYVDGQNMLAALDDFFWADQRSLDDALDQLETEVFGGMPVGAMLASFIGADAYAAKRAAQYVQRTFAKKGTRDA